MMKYKECTIIYKTGTDYLGSKQKGQFINQECVYTLLLNSTKKWRAITFWFHKETDILNVLSMYIIDIKLRFVCVRNG